MRYIRIVATLCTLALVGCSGSSVVTAPHGATFGGTTSFLTLSPTPLQLTDVAPSDSITVSGDTPGASYTPTADPSCSTDQGSIAVAGDGQAQVDQAASPLMFLGYAVGATPPASCTITIAGSDGLTASVTATYQLEVLQTSAVTRRQPLSIRPQGATPTSVIITGADQVIPITTTAFSGVTTATVNAACATGNGGIQVTPKKMTGDGTFAIVAFGQGAVTKICNVVFADPTGDVAQVNVSVAIGALNRFTVSRSTVQFGCTSPATPKVCQTQNVTLSEVGATSFSIVTRPGYVNSCYGAFDGPMTMSTGNGVYAKSVAGPTANVTFNGYADSTPLGCSAIIITDNGTPAQRYTLNVNTKVAAGDGRAAATPPPCVGNDSHVAVPSAPHGMYVWNPYTVDGGVYESQLESSVIGIDHSLCGASLVVRWSDLEPTKGNFDFSEIDGPRGLALPYTNAGLTINLLFEDGPERGPNNPVTPSWVTALSGDAVPIVNCNDQPPAPDYMSPTFEADWAAFICAAVAHFSYNNSALAPKIGYMRFAIGFGVEAIPAHFDTGEHADCLAKWEADPVDFTYDGWVQHAKNVVNVVGSITTDKQMMVALNELDGGPDFYDYPDQVTEDAAKKGVGFGTENLGISNVALQTSTPGACDPQAKLENLYWCQAFTRHVGEVPFEFQTIVASTAPQPGESSIYLPNALVYGLDNNTQIFELYPQEWLAANVAGFTDPADQTADQAALHNSSLMLGASH